MGNVDSIPVVSQSKSAIQAMCGDTAGATATQQNFTRGCPVVSQLRSLVEASMGDPAAATETQMYFLKGVGALADGIPVVGHAKGAIHYAVGDSEGGDRAMKNASRTVGVMGGGAVGMLTAGPVGAVAGGLAGGALMDGVTTGIDSAVHGEYRPNGNIASITDMASGKSKSLSGDVVDLCFGMAMDGIAGYGAGQLTNKLVDAKTTQKMYRVTTTDNAAAAVKNGELTVAPNQAGTLGETWITNDIQHSKSYIAQKTKNAAPGTTYNCVEVKVKKSYYNSMKKDTIPQQGSRAINKARGAKPKNVYNVQKLASNHPDGSVNIGIKGPNLAEFNQHVVDVRFIDPNMQYPSGVTTTELGRYGSTSVACVADNGESDEYSRM